MSQEAPVVPDHTLIRPIGRGAFGEVWLARNSLDTYRAVKIVRQNTLDSNHHFEREFKGIQRFEPVSRLHGGLIDVLHVGRSPDGSYFYYVMELGDDLEPRQQFAVEEYEPRTLAAEASRDHRIAAQESALIGAQLADALGFLHEQGLIHRDIKPSNILFVRGNVKIGDPGLVALIEASQSHLGTLGYIPPEGPGSPQADIFSLGKVLYVISTGKQPGDYPTLPDDMTEYPDADYLRRLNSVILRACAYNPQDRYPTARELRSDLLEVHAGGSPAENRRRLRIAMRIGVILAVLFTLTGGALLRARQAAAKEAGRLARSHSESGNRLLDANDLFGALPFLAESLRVEPDPERAGEFVSRQISFAWRYGPRLCAQWNFKKSVNRVAFDPAKGTLAVAAASGEVWLWDWPDSTPTPLGRHGTPEQPEEAESVAFDASGQWLASGGLDGMLRLWKVGGETHHSIKARSGIYAAAFHPKGAQLAAGCGDGSVLLTDFEGLQQRVVQCGQHAIRSVAFSPDGIHLVAGDEGGGIHEIHIVTGGITRKQKLIWVYDVAYNADGSRLAVASGNRAHLDPFASTSGARIRHRTLVRSVAFDPLPESEGHLLLTSCLDNTIRLWSCTEDQEVMSPLHTEANPTHAAFSRDGRFIAVSTVGGIVRVYELPRKLGARGPQIAVASGNGRRYAMVEQGTNVLIINATSNVVEKTFRFAGGRVSALALDRAGERLLTRQNRDPNMAHYEIWSIVANNLIGATNIPRGVLEEFSPAGKTVAFLRNDALTLWKPEGGANFTKAWQLSSPGDCEVRFSATGDRLAAAWSSNVWVVATSPAGVVAEWSVPHRAYTVDIDGNGEHLIVGEAPEGLKASTNFVWDIRSQKRASAPLVREDGSYVARFDPSGQWVIVADEMKLSSVYRRSDWSAVLPMMRHFGIVVDANFSSDGRYVATLTGDRGGDQPGVRVWDLVAGRPITPPLPVEGRGKLSFVAGETAVFCSTFGGGWHRWEIDSLSTSPDELIELAHLLSCRRLTPSGEATAIRAAELDELWRKLRAARPEWFAFSSASNLEGGRGRADK